MSRRKRRRLASEEHRQMMMERQLSRCRNPALAKIVERNIDAIEMHRLEAEAEKTFHDRLADAITRFSGSMPFVYFHVAIFAIWITANTNLLGVTAFDPYPFGMLTTIVSLEAIFLSTFMLVSQNRQGELAERRAELDLQINLLAEYEVTRILTLVDELARHAGICPCEDVDIDELKKDVTPEALLSELEGRARHAPAHQANSLKKTPTYTRSNSK